MLSLYKPKKLFYIFTILLLSISINTDSIFAARCPGTGVSLPDTQRVAGQVLILNGMGIREATVLQVNVYVAGLYLLHKTKSVKKILDKSTIKKIILCFVRDVNKDDITAAFKESYMINGGNKISGSSHLGKLNSFMENMKEGRKMTFTYVPGSGLLVKVNGRKKGIIKHPDFIKVFYKFFLGRPPNQSLKDGLLGKIKCED